VSATAEELVEPLLRDECTQAAAGRSISVGIHEATLARHRQRQQNPHWRDDYRATRHKVERKSHLIRHHHGGRRARMRGNTTIDADFNLLAAAANLARLAVRSTPTGWAT